MDTYIQAIREHHNVTSEKLDLTARLSQRLVSEICITSKKTIRTWQDIGVNMLAYL